MSIFLELRCEDQNEPHAEGGWNREKQRRERCWSHDNEGCGIFSEDSIKEGLEGIRMLFRVAKKVGWKKIKGRGWVCPYCAKKREETENA